MPRVLAIAPYFPPRRRVGALRPYRFLSRMAALGWESRVICLATPGAELDVATAERLRSVPRWEISTPMDRTRGRAQSDLETVRRPPPIPTQQPAVHAHPAPPRHGRRARLAGLAKRAGNWAADRVDTSFPVDTWAPLLALSAPAMLKRAEDYRPDLIWSTADPWSSLGLGHLLSSRLGVPWVCDLRDPWTLCPLRSADRTPMGRVIDGRLERLWLSAATSVGFTSRLTLERYANHYPALADKLFSEPNSYDAPFDAAAFDLNATPRGAEADPTRPLGALFFGGFRDSAPAGLLVDALGAAGGAAAGMQVRSVGGLPERDAKRARQTGVLGCFPSMDSVPYSAAPAAIGAADLLVLTTSPQRPEMIPAKLWDYLPAGRPILSISANPEIAEVLRDTGLGVQVDPTAPDASDQLTRRLLEARDNLRQGQPAFAKFQPRAARVQTYGAGPSTERLLAHFERALSRGRR